MLQGMLMSAIFAKATEVGVTDTDNAASVTLMSTDVGSYNLPELLSSRSFYLGRCDYHSRYANPRTLGHYSSNWIRSVALEQPNWNCFRWSGSSLLHRFTCYYNRESLLQELYASLGRESPEASW